MTVFFLASSTVGQMRNQVFPWGFSSSTRDSWGLPASCAMSMTVHGCTSKYQHRACQPRHLRLCITIQLQGRQRVAFLPQIYSYLTSVNLWCYHYFSLFLFFIFTNIVYPFSALEVFVHLNTIFWTYHSLLPALPILSRWPVPHHLLSFTSSICSSS